MDNEIIEIINTNGNVEKVQVVTYLISDDGLSKYLVYTKGEVQGAEEDRVIYISKMISDNGVSKLEEIIDDVEWTNVQKLLKKIANASAV